MLSFVLLVVGIASALIAGYLWVVAAAAAMLHLLWSVYYFRLRYTIRDNTLFIDSGLLFRRQRAIPLDNMLWQTVIMVPFSRRAIATVIHTAGGWVVIFAELSTQC